ncbi:MAG: tetratricopeptide repeat protein, partial [Nitrospinota bacterium]
PPGRKRREGGMLTLLIVSFLIGVGIASLLVLVLRSRRAFQGPVGQASGLDADLISHDDIEGATPMEEAEGMGDAGPDPAAPAGMPFGSVTPGSVTPGSVTPGSVTREAGDGEPDDELPQPGAEPLEAGAPQRAGPAGYDPFEDEGFSEAQLIETDLSPAGETGEGEEAIDEALPEAEAYREPAPREAAPRRADLGALWRRPRELVVEYELPDPPLLDAWRPLGSRDADRGGEADTTSAGVELPASFASALHDVAGAIDAEERRGEAVPPETHYDLALGCYYAGEFESAVAYLQMTLDAGLAPARPLNLLGLTYHRQGLEAEAETRLKEAAFAEDVPPSDRATILTNLGLVCTYRRAPDDALGYYGRALEIHRQQGDRRAQAETLSRMGRLCRAKNALQEAAGYQTEALERWREVGDRAKVALELRLLAAIYRAKGDYDQALDLSRRALAMNQEMGDRREEAINLGNIGLIYSLGKDLPKALECYHAALSLHQEVGNFRGQANNLGNIGNVLYLQGRTEAALESYRSALEINRKIGYRWGEAVDLGNIGRIELRENNLEAAKTTLRAALEIFSELNATPQAKAIQDTLAQIDAHARPES